MHQNRFAVKGVISTIDRAPALPGREGLVERVRRVILGQGKAVCHRLASAMATIMKARANNEHMMRTVSTVIVLPPQSPAVARSQGEATLGSTLRRRLIPLSRASVSQDRRDPLCCEGGNWYQWLLRGREGRIRLLAAPSPPWSRGFGERSLRGYTAPIARPPGALSAGFLEAPKGR